MSHSSLTHAILHQAIAFIRDGNMRRARALGFSDEELRELRRMTATDIDAISSDGPVVCRLAVDHEVLLVLIRRLTQDQDRDAMIDRALTLGASVQMMSEYFGLTGNDCSTRRQLLGLPSRQGRLAMPGESAEHDAWHRWQQITDDPKVERSLGDISGMMVLAEETGIPLAVVYTLIKRWLYGESEDSGDVSPTSDSHEVGGRVCTG